MNRFKLESLKNAFSQLLQRCGDWIRRFGRFRPFGRGGDEPEAFPGSDTRWVWDPERKVWRMELTYTFRSLEVRMQAGEAEAPDGVRAMRRIMGKRS